MLFVERIAYFVVRSALLWTVVNTKIPIDGIIILWNPVGINREGVKMRKEQNINETEFTRRVLMAMVVDLEDLTHSIERVKYQITAMAKVNGVPTPEKSRKTCR